MQEIFTKNLQELTNKQMNKILEEIRDEIETRTIKRSSCLFLKDEQN